MIIFDDFVTISTETQTIVLFETLNTYDITPLPSPNMSYVSSSLFMG